MRCFLLSGLLVTSLTGCSSLPFEIVERSTPVSTGSTSLGTSIAPSMSMAALPPAAGAVVSVIERQRGNALQHEVTLTGAPPNYGENQIIVTAFRKTQSSGDGAAEDQIPDKRPTEDDINAEMAQSFPRGLPQISSAAPQNRAGTFAYAFGRTGNVSCLYAWQWIQTGSRLTNPPVSLRVRLCRPGTTEEVLVDYVRQIYLMPRNQPGQSAPLMASGAMGRPPGDALSAARGTRQPTYAYQPHPYGTTYQSAAAPYYPKADNIAGPKTVQRVVVKKVIIRKIVRRNVVAPQVYSYAPPAAPPAAATAPAATLATPAVPAAVPRTTGGYSAVPMPQ